MLQLLLVASTLCLKISFKNAQLPGNKISIINKVLLNQRYLKLLKQIRILQKKINYFRSGQFFKNQYNLNLL